MSLVNTCVHEYSKEISPLYVVKFVLLQKQQTTWSYPISPATNRNYQKQPRNHPKLLASPEPPATPPCNEPTNFTLFFYCWLWTWFHNQESRITEAYRCSVRKCVLRNFAKFIRTHLSRSLFLIKLRVYILQLHWKKVL